MLTASVLMGVAVMVAMVGAQRPMMRRADDDEDIPACGGGSSVYQKSEEDEERSRRVCPERAVCADVWNTVRDWYNGTRCRDHRVMYNCMCPDNQQCPTDNPDHVLYANDKQSYYMCEPACELESCRTGVRPARELVRSMRANSYAYYRMNCRCADHHVPLPSRGRRGRLNRATRYRAVRFDRRNRLVYTQFSCVRFIQNNDPCY